MRSPAGDLRWGSVVRRPVVECGGFSGRETNMRKATIGLLVTLCLWGATSWQNQPQWRVVMEQHMIGGTVAQNNVPIFTPEKNSVYRLSATCSSLGTNGSWNFLFIWNDLPGNPASASEIGR